MKKLFLFILISLSYVIGVTWSSAHAEGGYDFVLTWGSYGSGDGQFLNQLKGGIAIDSSGNVYVADRSNNRIQKFDSSGNFITKWGSMGTGDGEFFSPSGVAIDFSDNVFVAEENNNRIQKFDSSENFLTKWGSQGAGDAQFDVPSGVSVDFSGNVYVADLSNDRIQKFDSSGNFITKWGSYGSGDGQFLFLRGVAVDSSGNVFVADQISDRIQKFDSSGNFLAKWGSMGSGDGEFNGPANISFDSSGNVYVADMGNNRIQKFNSSGNFLTKWGSYGSGAGQFKGPVGVVVDSSDDVYVVDYDNHRIQKFTPSATTTSTTTVPATTTSSSTTTSTPSTTTTASGGGTTTTTTISGGSTTSTTATGTSTTTTASGNTTSTTTTAAGNNTSTSSSTTTAIICTDFDNDGYSSMGGTCGQVDCDDYDSTIYPDATEKCEDNKDNNCDGTVNEDCVDPCPDSDGDGYAANNDECGELDCDDNDAAVNPQATEVCDNGKDDECDGKIDGNDEDCFEEPADVDIITYSISGTISGDLTKEVWLYLNGPVERALKSDHNGKYVFESLVPGTYTITPLRGRIIFEPPMHTVEIIQFDMFMNDFISYTPGALISEAKANPYNGPDDGQTPILFTSMVSAAAGLKSVTLDLTSIGGNPTQPMYDDGTNGDETGADGIYSIQTTVAALTPPGNKGIVVRAVDNLDRPIEEVVDFEVTSQIVDTVKGSNKCSNTIENKVRGQKMRIRYSLKNSGGLRIARACATTLDVYQPGNSLYQGGIPVSTAEGELVIDNAVEGTWTYTVSNSCPDAKIYSITTAAGGTGMVQGIVVDAQTGEYLDNVTISTNGGGSAVTSLGYYLLMHTAGTYSVSAQSPAYMSTALPVTLYAGSSIACDMAMVAENKGSGGSDVKRCPATKVMDLDKQGLAKLRRFRDSVLNKSEFGRRCVRLYYRYGDEVTGILTGNAALCDDVRECVMLVLQQIDQGAEDDLMNLSKFESDNLIHCLEMLIPFARKALREEIDNIIEVIKDTE